jgi:HSP20 family protein
MFEMIPFRKGQAARRGDFYTQLFNNFFNDDFFGAAGMMPEAFKVDLRETDKAYIVEAELPGVKKEAIDISFENNYLTISAKRDESTETKTDSYIRRECHYGELKRCFYMDNIDESNIDASFKDGILMLKLPKKAAGDGRKKIDIQ